MLCTCMFEGYAMLKLKRLDGSLISTSEITAAADIDTKKYVCDRVGLTSDDSAFVLSETVLLS